jgi:hypothetical protein
MYLLLYNLPMSWLQLNFLVDSEKMQYTPWGSAAGTYRDKHHPEIIKGMIMTRESLLY